MGKRSSKVFKGLYIANIIIIVVILLIPTVIGPSPILVFNTLAIFASISFGTTFLIINIWGIIKFIEKRTYFLVVSFLLLAWITWEIIVISNGVHLP